MALAVRRHGPCGMSGARVLVAGGGPAGLATALALARRGVAAVVCDAGPPGRPRLCGEFLSPEAAGVLEELGAPGLLRRLGALPAGRVRWTAAAGGRILADASWDLETPGFGLSRESLDAALEEVAVEAGVEVRRPCRVLGFRGGAGGVEARTTEGTIRAGALVLATGRVPDLAGRTARPPEGWVAVKVHVRGVDLHGTTEVHCVTGAYAGLVEVAAAGGPVVNACALARRDAWDRAGASPAGLWQAIASGNPAFGERWRDAVAVPGSAVAAAGFGFTGRAGTGGGEPPSFLVGDAAALIAPLCGDGQAMALGGGAALGGILADADAGGGERFPASLRAAAARWERRLAGEFSTRLRLGRWLQSILLRPAPAAAFLRAARGSPSLRGWLFRATRGGARRRDAG